MVFGSSGSPLVVNGLATTRFVVSPGCVLSMATNSTATVTEPPTASGPTFVQSIVPSLALSSDAGTAPTYDRKVVS